MTTVEVIIPFWGKDSERLASLCWVKKQLIASDLNVVVVVSKVSVDISKAAVLWPVIQRSDADIVVIHDADVWCHGVSRAIYAVTDGKVAWAKPHDRVLRLSQHASEAFRHLDGSSPRSTKLELVRPPYQGVVGGGVVVLRREVALDVPMDVRFVGWGQEDESWGHALWTLYEPPWLDKDPLVHLWHPVQERMNRRWGSINSRRLFERYYRAITDPTEMRKIILEAHSALGSHESVGDSRLSVV